MGLFSRQRAPGESPPGEPGSAADGSEQEALRLIDRGNASEDAGRAEEALALYEAAVRLAPGLARAHINRGNVLLALGKAAEALEAYAEAIARNPDYAPAYYNMGNTYLRLARHEAALGAYRKALALQPDLVDAELAMGCVLEDGGRHVESAACFRRVLAVNPAYAAVHINLGNALRNLGQLDEAVASYRRALEIDPAYASVRSELAGALQDLGQFDAAVLIYREMLRDNPDDREALMRLGICLQSLGLLEDAAAAFRRTLEVKPDDVAAHTNLGNVLKRLGQVDDAVTSYRRGLAIDPEFAVGHYNLAITLYELGHVVDAVASYRQVVRINPNMADAHVNLGNALNDLGQIEDAVASYRRAVEIAPDSAIAYNNLGNALIALGKIDDAQLHFQRALKIRPDFAEAHAGLGHCQTALGLLDQGAASHRRALAINPEMADAHNNLGNTLYHLGQIEDAALSFRRALQIKPDTPQAYTGLLFALSHNEAISPESLLAEHLRFGAQFEPPLRASRPRHGNERDPERQLRIGFVSADWRDHAIAYFVEPLLAHLAGSPALSLHAYYNHAVEDDTTARLRCHFKDWTPTVRLSDGDLANKIEADRIDILIDLSGHTAGNRLLTFARKPAPVQASWMGYPGTTGLRAMDYYLADPFLLPMREFAGQFSEKLVHLPANAPFLPDKRAPEVNALPALTTGYVTFGTFNRLSKLRPAVIALWSRLLRAAPSARMVLGGMPPDGQYDALIARFAQEGIARGRLSFHPRCGMSAYLALHHHVDVCLDTFPYAGGTTTAHALWMGVSTLTLAGSTPPSRQGAAVLGHVELESFVAHDASDFERKGLAWIADLEALARLRAELRERHERSVMQRPDWIADGLERALRIMWKRWCAGLPPDSIDVHHPATDRAMQGGRRPQAA